MIAKQITVKEIKCEHGGDIYTLYYSKKTDDNNMINSINKHVPNGYKIISIELKKVRFQMSDSDFIKYAKEVK